MSKLAREWRDHTIKQFSIATGLLLSLGVAALGFGLNLLRDEHFRFLLCARQKNILYLGLVFLFVSVLLGVLAMLTRLLRTRRTFLRVGESENDEDAGKSDLQYEINLLGKITHVLLISQGAFLLLGIFVLMIIICVVYV